VSDTAVPAVVDRPPEHWDSFLLTVDVTDDHIVRGLPSTCTSCPIALAILDAGQRIGLPFVDGVPVAVYGDDVQLTLKVSRDYVGLLPWAARNFIHHFDHGEPGLVGPFTFRVTFHPGRRLGGE
jgi:hypothetical protein